MENKLPLADPVFQSTDANLPQNVVTSESQLMGFVPMTSDASNNYGDAAENPQNDKNEEDNDIDLSRICDSCFCCCVDCDCDALCDTGWCERCCDTAAMCEGCAACCEADGCCSACTSICELLTCCSN